MKKNVFLFLLMAVVLFIDSCSDSTVDNDQLLKSTEYDDCLIEEAENWFLANPEKSNFPILEFADDLMWNQAMVHDVDTAMII